MEWFVFWYIEFCLYCAVEQNTVKNIHIGIVLGLASGSILEDNIMLDSYVLYAVLTNTESKILISKSFRYVNDQITCTNNLCCLKNAAGSKPLK